ncbi:hypothetical protein [Atlantibacter hermannii]|uniref:hypothetical protein n=1 Tax=Atlantibacter hermannii TaxID=565 RepID=UPI0028982432|nr:hypothetical protein [Atlantibacter hermannii]
MEAYEIQAVIKNLQKQARTAKIISNALIYTLIFVIFILFYSAYTMNDRYSPAGIFGDYISDIIGKKVPDRRLAGAEYEKSLNENLKNLDAVNNEFQASIDALKGSIITNQISRAITSGILTLTVIFMGLYTIKITLMFIRYYAQLAARYETQVTAFMAANGDIDKTIKLIQALSSNEITMGAAPDSIYEKALEIVSKALAVKKD